MIFQLYIKKPNPNKMWAKKSKLPIGQLAFELAK